MKKIVIILAFLLTAFAGRTQTFSEWFKQKKTQIKYLVEQIGALQAYITVVQKGYNITKAGLNTIGDIKNGEFHLHGDFFGSLKSINPSVAKYYKVAAIVTLEADILQRAGKLKNTLRSGGQMSAGELTYIDQVLSHLLDVCTDELQALAAVTTAGELEMSDDERIKRIDGLYNGARDKDMFIQSFSNDAIGLSANRMAEAAETARLKQLYGK